MYWWLLYITRGILYWLPIIGSFVAALVAFVLGSWLVSWRNRPILSVQFTHADIRVNTLTDAIFYKIKVANTGRRSVRNAIVKIRTPMTGGGGLFIAKWDSSPEPFVKYAFLPEASPPLADYLDISPFLVAESQQSVSIPPGGKKGVSPDIEAALFYWYPLSGPHRLNKYGLRPFSPHVFYMARDSVIHVIPDCDFEEGMIYIIGDDYIGTIGYKLKIPEMHSQAGIEFSLHEKRLPGCQRIRIWKHEEKRAVRD